MAVAELEKVPWLVAEDMCLMQFNGPDDTHCLLGWQETVDPDDEYGILQALRKASGKRDTVIPWIGASNDAHTNAENASLWNKAMRSLGYRRAKGWMVI